MCNEPASLVTKVCNKICNVCPSQLCYMLQTPHRKTRPFQHKSKPILQTSCMDKLRIQASFWHSQSHPNCTDNRHTCRQDCCSKLLVRKQAAGSLREVRSALKSSRRHDQTHLLHQVQLLRKVHHDQAECQSAQRPCRKVSTNQKSRDCEPFSGGMGQTIMTCNGMSR